MPRPSERDLAELIQTYGCGAYTTFVVRANSCSAGERVTMGVGWREGRLPELALTERDREAEEVGEAMAVAASRGRPGDAANVCPVCADERVVVGRGEAGRGQTGVFFPGSKG